MAKVGAIGPGEAGGPVRGGLKALYGRRVELAGPGHGSQRQALDRRLTGMLDGLKDDRAVDAVLQARRREMEQGRVAEREIGRALGPEREQNRRRDRER